MLLPSQNAYLPLTFRLSIVSVINLALSIFETHNLDK